MARQFAVVTGASTGIGYELAECCAAEGFDLRGEGDIVPGWMNKLRSAIALVTPWSILAEQHS